MPIELWIRDTGERMLATFAAAAVTWLLAGPALDASWVQALAAAVIPPVLVVLSSALPGLVYTGPVWWIDATVRVVRSFLQGFVGALIADTMVLDVSFWQAAALAGALAAWAAVKSIIAAKVAGTISPASLAKVR